MKSANATSIQTGALGSMELPNKVHLGDGSALDFLPPPQVKEQVWSTGSWSAATETGTLGHSPRALQCRKSRQTILCLATNVELADDLRDYAYRNGSETYRKV